MNSIRSLLAFVRRVLPPQLAACFSRFGNPVAGCLFLLSFKQYRTSGKTFIIPRRFDHLGYYSEFFFDVYEWAERQLIQRHIRNTDSVLEFGASIGVISVLTSNMLDAQANHLVVEANPELLPYLFANRLRNSSNFVIEFAAIGSGKSTLIDFSSQPNASHATTSSKGTPIVTRTLGELTRKHGHFDVLICDIEGAEYSLLTQPDNELEGFRCVIVEFHESVYGQNGLAECRDSLTRLGFQSKDSISTVEVWERNSI